MKIAKEKMTLFTTPEGREFILTGVDELDEDDFDAEIAALSRNRELMEFLEARSRETNRISLAEAKRRLELD